jgi:hypothetical protein
MTDVSKCPQLLQRVKPTEAAPAEPKKEEKAATAGA